VALINIFFVFLHRGSVLNSSSSQRSLTALLAMIALALIWFADDLPTNERHPGDPALTTYLDFPAYRFERSQKWMLPGINLNIGKNSYLVIGWLLLVTALPVTAALTWLVRGSW
jgi:hypothetical protein